MLVAQNSPAIFLSTKYKRRDVWRAVVIILTQVTSNWSQTALHLCPVIILFIPCVYCQTCKQKCLHINLAKLFCREMCTEYISTIAAGNVGFVQQRLTLNVLKERNSFINSLQFQKYGHVIWYSNSLMFQNLLSVARINVIYYVFYC